jgi:hypothetical protein
MEDAEPGRMVCPRSFVTITAVGPNPIGQGVLKLEDMASYQRSGYDPFVEKATRPRMAETGEATEGTGGAIRSDNSNWKSLMPILSKESKSRNLRKIGAGDEWRTSLARVGTSKMKRRRPEGAEGGVGDAAEGAIHPK